MFANRTSSLFDEFKFINQTRQIAATYGGGGKIFNRTSLEGIRKQLDTDPQGAVQIFGNRVVNCSSGVAQRARAGSMRKELDYIQNFTGSLFSFQDVLRVDFAGNQINGLWAVNDIGFYSENSPQFRYFGHGVKKLTAVSGSS